MGSVAALYACGAAILCAFIHRHNCIAEIGERWLLSPRQIRMVYAGIYTVSGVLTRELQFPMIALLLIFHFSRVDPHSLLIFLEDVSYASDAR